MNNNCCEAQELLEWLRTVIPSVDCKDAAYIGRMFYSNHA